MSEQENKSNIIYIPIDLEEDFDGGHLERVIRETPEGEAKTILMKLHHNWVVSIGHPEWSMIKQ